MAVFPAPSIDDAAVDRAPVDNSGEFVRAHISRVPYLPGLDGMRALAVVAVMVYHANSSWLPGGFLGVEMFFVISGYLITLLLIAERERDLSGLADQVLDPSGPPSAACAVRADRPAHDLDGVVRARRARPTARRRDRRVLLRVELVPDLGRARIHLGGRLRAAAAPVEPRRRGAVLPDLADRDDRVPRSQRHPAGRQLQSMVVPRGGRGHRGRRGALSPGPDR